MSARQPPNGKYPSEPTAELDGAMTGRRQASAPALLLKPKPLTTVYGTTLLQPPPLRRAYSLDSRPARDVAGTTVVSVAPVPTTMCHICFENVPTTNTVQLTASRHRFCAPCLKQYLELKIKDGNVFPVCFHPIEALSLSPVVERNEELVASTATPATTTTACGTRIQDAQLQTLVDREIWAKCTLFRFNMANATARECPFCAHPQQCAGPSQPACTCTECGCAFCFFHGNAHASTARGCNHMRCVVCRTDFCWLCNEKLERGAVSDHFSVMNLTGCGGRQFDNVGPHGRASLWGRFCRLYEAMHFYYGLLLYKAAFFLAYAPAYLLAAAVWLLIAGVTRARPIRTISSTPFSSVVTLARKGTAVIAASAAFVYSFLYAFQVLPDCVVMVYSLIQIVKSFGDIVVMTWPPLVSSLRRAWRWMHVCTRHALRALRLRLLSGGPMQERERQALLA